MPKWLKIVLIILGISFLICAGGVVTCGLLAKKVGESAVEGAEEAKKFAATHDGKGCFDEAIKKTKDCGDTKSITGAGCIMNTTMFFQACMGETKDPKAACADKPAKDETFEQWIERKCADNGMKGSDGCKAIVAQIETHCPFGMQEPEMPKDTDGEPPPMDKPEEKPAE